RLPLPGASIVAVGLGSGGTTDALGNATLTLPAGEEELLVYSPEHAFGQTRIRVVAGETGAVSVYLYRTQPGEFSALVPGEQRRDAPAQTNLPREEPRHNPRNTADPMPRLAPL